MSKLQVAPGKFQNGITFNASDGGWIGETGIAASGRRTRNFDGFSGKWLRVVPGGIRLADFQSNPLFLFRHKTESLEDILGETAVSLEGGRLVHRPTFYGLTERSKLAAEYWKRRIGGTSVRIEFGDEDYANMYETDTEFVIPTSNLVEVSYAPLMADPGANNRDVLQQVALALGFSPQRAAQLLEVKMEEKDTDLQEGIEAGAEDQPFFTPEDEVALAVALTENEQAYHVLYRRIEADMTVKFEVQLAEMQNRYDAAIARLNGERIRTEPVETPRRQQKFSTTRQQEATPPTNIRQPQNTPPAKSNGGASKWAQRTAAKK